MDRIGRKICAENEEDFSTGYNDTTREKAALLSSECPVTRSIKPKLNDHLSERMVRGF